MNKFSKINTIIFILTYIICNSIFANSDTAQITKSRIYKFDIKEQIAPPVWRKTKMALQQAADTNANIIIIHMNTYGGMLESADSIRTAILNSKIPIYVFIDNNAASAGALISIACDSIYMRSGGNIGAATVVNQSGEQMPDKYQSYMRAMMRSTAEAKGRDPKIAEAMVDARIHVENVSDSGKVLTFTTREAILHNFCEGEAESIIEVIDKLGIKEYEIIRQELNATDKIISLLINPFVSGILIMLIIGGIYFELQSPGIGFPIVASVVAALLYFAPLYLEGLAENWEILVFIAGVLLMIIEIFVIPGFGVAGFAGIILIVTGLTLSMVDNLGFNFDAQTIQAIGQAFFIVVTAIFIALITSFYLSQKMLTSHTFLGGMALATSQEKSEGFTSEDRTYSSRIGQEGIAHTDLRPAGKVMIDDQIFDAASEAGFISKGERVSVRDYSTSQLFVIKI
ncbi:MAG: nodulation protein NfeD [Bacteroidales bacterium]|nr:nodulation protein NfeD [Bacteroidales bacterium]